MTRILAGAAAVVAALFLAPSPSHAASFNCRLATLPAEVLICHDRTLGAMDESMARRYYMLINTAPPDAALQIKAEQRAWLRGRNLCGYDGRCVFNAYRHRLGQLDEWRELVGGPRPFGRYAGPPLFAPPPGFYEDEDSYDDEDYPPGYYGDEEEGVVPFEDPDDGYYFGPGG